MGSAGFHALDGAVRSPDRSAVDGAIDLDIRRQPMVAAGGWSSNDPGVSRPSMPTSWIAERWMRTGCLSGVDARSGHEPRRSPMNDPCRC